MLIDHVSPIIHLMITEKKFRNIKDLLRGLQSADMADLIRNLPPPERVVIFRLLEKDLAAEVFSHFGLQEQKALLELFTEEHAREIIAEMEPDDRTELLEELPAGVVKRLIEFLDHKEREKVSELLNYPDDSAGRLMTPDMVELRPRMTVEEAIEHIRKTAPDKETIYYCYVIDEFRKLLGIASLRELLLAKPLTKVGELISDNVISVKTTDDQEEVARLIERYDLLALPVVDQEGRLVGIITVDDIVDVIHEEATEDAHKLGGMEALDEPYLTIPLLRMIKKRAGWLVLLFLSEMLTATAMGYFSDEIARAVVLALFVPLIISSGGNSGSQAATLIIRAMALGEVTVRDWWNVMRREIISGLSLGTILGSIGFIRIAAWSLFSNIYGPYWLLVAATVYLALIGVVLWGTLAGSMLPFVLKRVGADPAISSAPFVATLIDVTGLVIYFSIAVLVLRGTLL
ncbi:MAG: magnesium transporter [Candidatus Tectomicrobia bacterium]|nr:magnesium transporter [Candidatus Tectomicrobia bacterium]